MLPVVNSKLFVVPDSFRRLRYAPRELDGIAEAPRLPRASQDPGPVGHDIRPERPETTLNPLKPIQAMLNKACAFSVCSRLEPHGPRSTVESRVEGQLQDVGGCRIELKTGQLGFYTLQHDLLTDSKIASLHLAVVEANCNSKP